MYLNVEVICIHQNPHHQMHPLHPNPHIPLRFALVLSHGIQPDLYSSTMVPHDLQAISAGAQGVCDILIGVDVTLPAGQMLGD
jgi:hypothetical protein